MHLMHKNTPPPPGTSPNTGNTSSTSKSNRSPTARPNGYSRGGGPRWAQSHIEEDRSIAEYRGYILSLLNRTTTPASDCAGRAFAAQPIAAYPPKDPAQCRADNCRAMSATEPNLDWLLDLLPAEPYGMTRHRHGPVRQRTIRVLPAWPRGRPPPDSRLSNAVCTHHSIPS